MERTLGKMNTSIERSFRRAIDKDGNVLFREVFMHFMHFINESGNITSSKLDKMIPGKLYKIARPGEKSHYGEVTYTFPTGETQRLVCVGGE